VFKTTMDRFLIFHSLSSQPRARDMDDAIAFMEQHWDTEPEHAAHDAEVLAKLKDPKVSCF